jgi:hypothetical protein
MSMQASGERGIRMVVVPRSLQHDIDAKIVAAEQAQGFELDEESRSSISNQLLCFFDENGYLPKFTLQKKAGEATNGER